jgi:hypothetical protein
MKKITKFLPDIFIIMGIVILSYNLFRPKNDPFGITFGTDYAVYKTFGILLISIGVDIVIRKFITNKK